MKRIIVSALLVLALCLLGGCGQAAEESAEGAKPKLLGISLEYSGGDVFVGTLLSEDDFALYADYSDGSRKKVELFGLEGLEITIAGDNTVRAVRGNYSAETTVKGIALEYVSLSASYIGKGITAGCVLSDGDFSATLIRNDGQEFAATEFSVSPRKVEFEGITEITVTAGELSQTIELTAPLLYHNRLEEIIAGGERVFVQRRTVGRSIPDVTGTPTAELPCGTPLLRTATYETGWDRVEDGGGRVFFVLSSVLGKDEPTQTAATALPTGYSVSDAPPKLGRLMDGTPFFATDSGFSLSETAAAALMSAKQPFAVYCLESGFTLSRDGNALIPANNSAMLSQALFALELIELGEITLETEFVLQARHIRADGLICAAGVDKSHTVRELLTYTLTYADTSAYAVLSDNLGVDEYNEFMESIGCEASAMLTERERFGFTAALDALAVRRELAIRAEESELVSSLLSGGVFANEFMPGGEYCVITFGEGVDSASLAAAAKEYRNYLAGRE